MILILAIILFAIVFFAKNSNDYFETFAVDTTIKTSRWKFDMTDPTQKWNEWYAIKQNGFKQSIGDLGLTMPNSKMTIVFMFRCDSGSTDWRNIFHFTNTGNNCCGNGDRIPAMWVYPDTTNRLHIRFSTNGNGNDGRDYTVVRPMNVPEFISLVFDDNTFSFYLNGTVVFSDSYNTIAPRQASGSFFIGDPWHSTKDLFIKNFAIYNGALTGQNISDIYSEISKVPFQDTAANLMSLATNFDNLPKPSWIYPETKREYRSIRYATIPWSDLNVPDYKNMALSFWIKLEGEVQDYYGFLYLLNGNNNIRSDPNAPRNTDTPFSVPMFVNGEKELVVMNIHENNKDFKIPLKQGTQTWITMTFSPNVENVYVDGAFKHSSTSQKKFIPPGEKTMLILGQGAKGVFIKDLKFYDHSLTETGIGILYKGLSS